MRALVTGGASGIGAALVARLRTERFDVESLDLVTGFDVTDPEAWEDTGPVDVACLNAGVLGGPPDPAELTLDGYRRALGVNVDGVVLGVRRLARVMPAGGRIVCTASLAGLTAVPDDPVYALTKHAVVGYVRSVALPLSKRGISINAVCPGFADTAMVAGTARAAALRGRTGHDCEGPRRDGRADGATDLRVCVEAGPEREDRHQCEPVAVLELLAEVVDVDVDLTVDRAQNCDACVGGGDEGHAFVLPGRLPPDESLGGKRLDDAGGEGGSA